MQESRVRLALAVTALYLWITMILLGAVVLETFMIYPNIFLDPPASLEATLEFMRVAAPSDFFPPLGFMSWVTGAGAALLSWRIGAARSWIFASLLFIVADGLVSMLFHWPRNTILFVEGPAVHSVAILQETAREFQRLHWSRLAFTAASAFAIFIGFLRVYGVWLLRHRSGGAPYRSE